MSEAKTEQPAVDAVTAPAVPGAETGQDVRKDGDDVDALLNQFETSTKTAEPAKPQTQPEPKAAPAVAAPAAPMTDPAVAEVRAYIRKQDMTKTVAAVRGDLDPARYDDRIVEAWLNVRATEDPRIANAWLSRHSNPQAFEKVVAHLGREFAKQYGNLPDRQATEDREAVTAAVRGASTKAPEGKAPDFSRMSNTEYRDAHFKEYGYYPSV